MDCDQALEDDGPCGVPQPVLQRPEHLANTRFAGMCCDQNMLDVFCLWGRGLGTVVVSDLPGRKDSASPMIVAGEGTPAPYLDLGRALDRFLKRTRHGHQDAGRRRPRGVDADKNPALGLSGSRDRGGSSRLADGGR